MTNKTAFSPADILLPNEGVDYSKWSVVACDQYTAQQDYWDEVEQIVGDAPSTLRLTLPEIYLEREDTPKRIAQIVKTMKEYQQEGVFTCYSDSLIYLERTQDDGRVRRGLVGKLDLEEYDYNKGATTQVRATEGTILSRIPPRVEVRKDATVELPHIMVLIDDRSKTVIEPLAGKTAQLKKVYDFELMQKGGHARGYVLDAQTQEQTMAALNKLCEKEAFEARYGVKDEPLLLFATGDGNHSLATAKACYENLKKTLPLEQAKKHPARYALIELVNLFDEALDFEPIHRVLFQVDAAKLRQHLLAAGAVTTPGAEQSVTLVTASGEEKIYFPKPTHTLVVGTIQAFLDDYLQQYGGEIDYVHGDEVVRDLAQKGNIGILFGDLGKEDLFETVLKDGAMPRKTFSMGHAWDKRYYLEARAIK